MTSQKSSANKQAARFDFVKTCIDTSLVSIINLLLGAYLFVVSPLIDIKNQLEVNPSGLLDEPYHLMAVSPYWSMFLQSVLMLLGLIYGFVAFKNISNKKANNFYFTNGLNRNTYYTNRIFAPVIPMAVTTLIPVIISVFVNIGYYGHAFYILQYGFWAFVDYITCIILGFLIVAVASVISYTKGMAIITALVGIYAPSAISSMVQYEFGAFLRGYSFNSVIEGDLSETFMFATEPIDIFSFVSGYAVHSYSSVPFEFIDTVLLSIAVNVVLFFVGKYVINKRKLEKVGQRNRNTVSAIFVSLVIACNACTLFGNVLLLSDFFKSKPGVAVYSLVIVAVIFAVFYIASAILLGTLKLKLKTFIAPASLSVAIIIFCCILSAGGFGYSSYVPQVTDIEFATITASEVYVSGDEYNKKTAYDYSGAIQPFTNRQYGETLVVANKEDLKILTEITKDLTEKSDNMVVYSDDFTSLYVDYYLSDGTKVSRSYDYIKEDYLVTENKLQNTNTYKAYLSLNLTNDIKNPYIQEIEETVKAYTRKYGSSVLGERNSLENYSSIEDYLPTYDKADLHLEETILVCEDGINTVDIENTKELREALLKDILSSSVKERFVGSGKPIGAVSFGYFSGETEEEREYNHTWSMYGESAFYLYDNMENTISYLKSVNAYDSLFTGSENGLTSVKVIKVGNNISSDEEAEEYTGIDKVFYCMNFSEKLDEISDLYYYDEYDYEEDELFNDSGLFGEYIDDNEKLNNMFKDSKEYTDETAMKAIYEKSRIMGVGNTDDYLVLLEYKDGLSALRFLTKEDADSLFK
ncbi:MAG: hypothetical protein ACI4IF_08065 [Acutalibacteraceae bacterium]